MAKTWKGRRAVVVCISLGLMGCTLGGGAMRIPASHFVYPNSNVYPISKTSGKDIDLCGLLFFNLGVPDGDDIEEATQQALQKAGGDLLINYRVESRVFIFPPLFSLCITNVVGTAAKMEVGTQQLSSVRAERRRRQHARARTAPARVKPSDVPASKPESRVWLFRGAQGTRGPFTTMEIGRLITSGELTATSRIWKSGWKNSHVIQNVPALAGFISESSPTKPPQETATWYYAIDGRAHGPVTRSRLKSLVDEGKIPKKVLVRQPGWSKWVPLKTALESKPASPGQPAQAVDPE